MKTIAIINQKGGVGKSTTAFEIGQGLKIKGYSILFVDLDSQCNLSYSMKAKTDGYNAMGILQRPETSQEEIQHTESGDIIAGSSALARADMVISETGKEYKLKEALDPLQGSYDYCIIDTPPALGILTINALTACNGIIIPAQADIYSLQGIIQLNDTINTIRKYCNPELKILGIVLTRYNGRSTFSREFAEMLASTSEKIGTQLYNTKIRECIAVKEAQGMRQSIYTYAKKSNASADYKALVNEIIEKEGN